MFSMTRSAPRWPVLASESGGAYEAPVPELSALLHELQTESAAIEASKRRMVGLVQDVAALGTLSRDVGWTIDEWLQVIARVPRFDANRMVRMVGRLPALPVTASLLRTGKISVEQAASICEATTRLKGPDLAEVEAAGARLAVDANERGDDGEVRWDVEAMVEQRRAPRDVERVEKRKADGAWLVAMPELDGGGSIHAGFDPAGFATALAAIEHAAGTPSPDTARKHQRADGLLSIASHWLAGPAASDDAAVEAGRARPSLQVVVDLAQVTDSVAGTLQRVAGRHVPRLTARTIEAIADNADLVVTLTDGVRPLAELAKQQSIPAAVRRAVILRDRGCRWAGCGAPAWQADVHHIVWRSEGGEHDSDALALLCRRHHRRLDDRRWRTWLDPITGAFTVQLGRKGTAHTTYPHGQVPAVPPPEVTENR